MPAAYGDLLALPGIGDYTAAAIASFAFGRRHVVLDTNVRRVVARPDRVFLANRYDGELIAPADIRNILRLVRGEGV